MYVDVSRLQPIPLEIYVKHWLLLYILPYAVWDWGSTIMTRASVASLSIWYTQFPTIVALCKAISTHSQLELVLLLLDGSAPNPTAAVTRSDTQPNATTTSGKKRGSVRQAQKGVKQPSLNSFLRYKRDYTEVILSDANFDIFLRLKFAKERRRLVAKTICRGNMKFCHDMQTKLQ